MKQVGTLVFEKALPPVSPGVSFVWGIACYCIERVITLNNPPPPPLSSGCAALTIAWPPLTWLPWLLPPMALLERTWHR